MIFFICNRNWNNWNKSVVNCKAFFYVFFKVLTMISSARVLTRISYARVHTRISYAKVLTRISYAKVLTRISCARGLTRVLYWNEFLLSSEYQELHFTDFQTRITLTQPKNLNLTWSKKFGITKKLKRQIALEKNWYGK